LDLQFYVSGCGFGVAADAKPQAAYRSRAKGMIT
jgi:hypothetical protein